MKETKEVILFLVALTNVLADVLEDKKISLAEAFQFVPVLLKVQPALNGIEGVKDEILNMDEAGKNELVAQIEEDLEIDNVKAKEIAKQSIDVALAVVEMIRIIRA